MGLFNKLLANVYSSCEHFKTVFFAYLPRYERKKTLATILNLAFVVPDDKMKINKHC